MQPHDDSVKLVGNFDALETARVIQELERSVSIDPALLAGWSELERLYRASGDTQKASVAARHRATLERLPAAVVAAGSLFSKGELAAAQHVLQDFQREHGKHAEALRLLARIAHRSNQLDAAAELFEEVLHAVPDYRAARADYARTLIEQQRHAEAQQHLEALLGQEPDNWDYLVLRATIHAGLGQHDLAIASYQRVLAVAPGWVHLYLLLGNSLKAVGRQQEAVAAYRTAATRQPGFGAACWSLANLKTYRFSDDEIGRMRATASSPAMCFALGKALEDRAEYESAWRYYERGNQLEAVRTPYEPRAVEHSLARLMETYTAEFLASRAGRGCADGERTPIFIVGLPRSGSTLLEQILASHSRIEGTQELPILGRLARAAADMDYRRLAERYLADSRAYTVSGKPFFIDKMPNNFRHIGLIHLMLPGAKIIDVRRDPMACCVSNFKQLYAAGHGFSYSVGALAHYYKSYLHTMSHWHAVLPDRVLQVGYEDLVEDLDTEVLRIVRFCGLEPEPGCLQFHRTERSIATASSEQVRQPLNRRGLTDWRHFEPWLAPLRAALA